MTGNNLKNTYAYVLFGVVAACEAYHWLEKTKKPKKKAQTRKFKENLMGQKPVPKKLRLSANTSGVFFGKTDSHTGYIGKPAGEDGHILVLGATGSGKTSAVIRPTTSKWKGSTVQVFIKGDHMDFVNERRKEGRNVLVFEPELGEKNQLRYDPFLMLKRDEEKFIDNVVKLAYVLLPDKGDANDIWACNARTFIKAAMIYTYHLGAEFTEFLDVLFLDSMRALIAEIEDCGNEDARKYISKLSDMDKRQLGSIAVDVNRLCELCSPTIKEAFTVSETTEVLDWEILNRPGEPVDVVIAIPESELQVYSKWIALLMEQLVNVLMQRQERKYDESDLPPVLLILDEGALLGEIPGLVQGMRTLRSRGVTILISAQDSTSIELTYGIIGRKAIYANCAYKLLLTLADSGDQEMFSKEAGSVFVEHKSFSEGTSYNFSSNGVSTGQNKGVTTALKERRLIYPSAFANLKDIVCITPEGSFQVRKSQYIKNAKEGARHD